MASGKAALCCIFCVKKTWAPFKCILWEAITTPHRARKPDALRKPGSARLRHSWGRALTCKTSRWPPGAGAPSAPPRTWRGGAARPCSCEHQDGTGAATSDGQFTQPFGQQIVNPVWCTQHTTATKKRQRFCCIPLGLNMKSASRQISAGLCWCRVSSSKLIPPTILAFHELHTLGFAAPAPAAVHSPDLEGCFARAEDGV